MSKADTPVWVRHTPVDVMGKVDDGQSSDGYCTLLDEHRIRIGRKEIAHYYRRIHRIVSTAGIEALAELSIEIEPDYEQLALHAVRIHRNGRIIDALPTASTRLVQVESELDRHVYRGTITAHIILQDVRVGDTIETEYSILGKNPVLDDHIVGVFELGWWRPVRRLRRELIVERGRVPEVRIRVHGQGPAPFVSDGSDALVMAWDLANVEPVSIEDRLPGWHYLMPWAQFSDYARWEDVVAWGLELYSFKAPLSADFRKKVDDIRTSTMNLREQALQAVRFVQDEVRYLSISVGPHSHRPHDPAQVLMQRFGDCKDKSLLLVAFLQELGIEAHVALVNTTTARGVTELLPSASAFDHVVVKAMVNGKPLWIDATASNQGGDLETQIPATFGVALVLKPGVRDLEIMPDIVLDEPDETIFSEIRFDEADVAILDMKTDFHGEQADAQRFYSLRAPRSKLAQRYLEFYAESHPAIRESRPLDLQDERATNVMRIVERYEIPNFWQNDPRWFAAESIRPFLELPRVRKRRAPLAMRHPVWRREEMRVHYPRPMQIEAQSVKIENAFFNFSYSAQSIDNVVILNHEYRSKTDIIPSKDVEAYLAALEQAREYQSFEILTPTFAHVEEPFRVTRAHWIFAGIAAGTLVSGIGLALWLPGRRKRAFLRRRRGDIGDQPDHPISVMNAATALQLVSKWRCSCGQILGASVDTARLSPLRYGGRMLHLMYVTCPRCETATRRYFAFDVPPPSEGSDQVEPQV